MAMLCDGASAWTRPAHLQWQAVSPILFTLQMKGMRDIFNMSGRPLSVFYSYCFYLFAYFFFFFFPSIYEKIGELIKIKRQSKINKTTNIGPHFGSGLLAHFKLAANFSFYLIFTTELWKCCMSFFWANRLEDRAVKMPGDLFKSRILVLMRWQ